MSGCWEEDEKEHIIHEMMDVSANINKYKGVIVITRARNGRVNYTWAGPDGDFDALDVVAMTELVGAETMRHMIESADDRGNNE